MMVLRIGLIKIINISILQANFNKLQRVVRVVEGARLESV